MRIVSLSAQKREDKGTRVAKRLRRNGRIPAVLYGAGGKHLLLTVSKHDFSKVLHTKVGEHAMVELHLENSDGEGKILTIIKEVQHDPITDYVIHADFVQIRPDVPIEFVLPIEFLGTPAGVKSGGIFTPLVRELTILCAPQDAPESIPIDVSMLEVGHSIHIKDISISNAKILHQPEMAVATVVLPRVAEEAKPVEPAPVECAEAEAPAEGEEQPRQDKDKEKEKRKKV